jgi:putative PIN family toxin of toxin-antitoxin system
MQQKSRIIIDTNLWISFLLTKDFQKLDATINNITLLFSDELLEEFIAVAKRPKFKNYFSQQDLISLLAVVNEHAVFINVNSDVAECRDEKDNFLLSLAKDGKADYLLTGDKDLLDIKRLGKTKIITISEFLLKK